MKAQTQLKTCAHLLALLGLWAVTLTEYFSIVWPVASIAVVVAGWFYEGPGKYTSAYQRIWIALSVCMLVFFPFDVSLLRNLLLPAVHVSFFVQTYLLLHPKTLKSHRWIFLVSFAQLLAATNLTTGLMFAVILTVYCVVAIYYVSLIQLFHGRQVSGDFSSVSNDGEVAPMGLLSLSFIWTLALLPLTVGFFYSAPRLQYALIARGTTLETLNQMRRTRQLTGFTKTVQLGTFGQIQEDQTLVLRVEVPPNSAALRMPLKWRGGALNIYDGIQWSSSRDFFAYHDGRRSAMADKNFGIVFPRQPELFIVDERYAKYRAAEEFDADPSLLKQVCYLEVPFSETLFGAKDIVAIRGPFTYSLARDFNRSFSMNNRQALPELISYTVYSRVAAPEENELRRVSDEKLAELLDNEDYGNYVRTNFLQLPVGLNPAVRKLALDITRDANTPYDKLKAIQSFLETRFTYSLDLNRPLTNDPLYDFLFVNRSGHCEYFATAMTVMARVVGIPSRLAKGFQRGQWNNNGGFFEVRQRDAHAWVEAYLPDYGWVEFDPSPRAVADQYIERQRSLIARMFSRRLMLLQIQWRRHVIGYNETRRLHLFDEIESALFHGIPKTVAGLLSRLVGIARSLTLFHALVVGAIILGAFAFTIALKKRGMLAALSWRMRRTKTAKRGTLFYERMLTLLEKRKIIKPPSVTPLEFLEFPPLREHPGFSDVETLTSIYYRVRFGDRALSEDETVAINAILRRLIESTRRRHIPSPATK
ncbi:DUF3488 domain-containing protein [Candidatus Poribacteria bacterium]|nr:DUF3488 domain-containing protein [Candidatus Poribacteria bacterium]